MRLEDYLQLPYTIVLRRDEDGEWVAEVDELEGCVTHGATPAEAVANLEEAKRLWIEEAIANGQPIPQPTIPEPLPSGRWVQRVPRSLHKTLAHLAKVEGVSLNQLVTTILAERVGMAHAATSPRTKTDVWADFESFDDAIVRGRAMRRRGVTFVNAIEAICRTVGEDWSERDPYAEDRKTHAH